jgi:glycosyltransferase 2 family protein
MSHRRWLIAAISFAAAIGASLYLVRSAFSAEGTRVSLPLAGHLLALGFVALEVVSRSTKIGLGARALGIPLGFGTSLRTCLGGDFGASITPARSGAEPARFLILREAGVRRSAVLLVLFAELLLELISIAVIAFIFALALDHSPLMVGVLLGMVGGYAAIVVGLGALAITLSRRNSNGPPPRWARRLRLHAGRWRTVQRLLRRVRESVATVRSMHVGFAAAALVVSIVHVLARLAVLPALVWALGAHVPISKLVLWPLVLLYGGAAAPAPGGGGLVEVGFRATLGGTIPASIFGASLIWWRFYTFYLYILLGALAAGATVLRALRIIGARAPAKPTIEEECVA